ncbi:hypothetical protein PUN28_020783 [Cardiocondyla obscurior]|uniref:BPTI/Kunitz inhibitor domain-containing protein n=1 Tax=Cardiocondyla obscurior TaxID=286306 RepID=A0AAW2E5X9_9HYME
MLLTHRAAPATAVSRSIGLYIRHGNGKGLKKSYYFFFLILQFRKQILTLVCMEQADPGPCRSYFQRWAFNPRKLMCVPFAYGGCRGNRNNFLTADECSNTCGIVSGSVIELL